VGGAGGLLDNWAIFETVGRGAPTFDYDPNAHPKAIVNLPGLTGWSGDRVNMSYYG
jgi:immune inhibitor A